MQGFVEVLKAVVVMDAEWVALRPSGVSQSGCGKGESNYDSQRFKWMAAKYDVIKEGHLILRTC